MATKSFTLAALLFIIVITSIYSTCKKGGLGCANAIYSFKISENLTPDKDSILIGDTIFLKVNALTNLNDLQSGNLVDYSNVTNLGNVVTFLRFLSPDKVQGAINNFKLIMLKGAKVNSVDPLSQQEVLFGEESGAYKLNLAIVAKDTGRFVITIGNSANVYRKNDNCTKANFTISFDGVDQHFYLLHLWRPDLVLDEQGKTKVYYFKVF